jgi:hypothetical protein
MTTTHTPGIKGKRNAKASAGLRDAVSDLLNVLEDLVERDRSEAAESGFTDDEMTWLEDARRAIAKAKHSSPDRLRPAGSSGGVWRELSAAPGARRKLASRFAREAEALQKSLRNNGEYQLDFENGHS